MTVQDPSLNQAVSQDLDDLKRQFEARSDELEQRVLQRTAELAAANQALQDEIAERERAQQRACAQTEAVVQTLNALSSAADLDQFLSHVLKAIVDQLRGVSGAFWFYDRLNRVARFLLDYEEGRITPAKSSQNRDGSALRRTPGWETFLAHTRPIVFDETLTDPDLISVRDKLLMPGIRTLLCVPLTLNGEVTGWFTIRSAEPRRYEASDLDLAQAMAYQATLAIQMTRLAEQGQQAAVLEERNRMAREIHDTLAQGFTGIVLQIEAAKQALAERPEQTREHLEQAGRLARASLAEARRSVQALRSQSLVDDDLCGALRRLTEEMTKSGDVSATCEVTGEPYPLPSETESHLLRIGQEALTNALRHAAAKAVRFQIDYLPGQVRLTVTDDGRGFEPACVSESGGFGLKGMHERASAVRGTLTVTSVPGKTRIRVVVPIALAVASAAP